MTDTSMYRAVKNMSAQASDRGSAMSISKGKRYGDKLPDNERSAPFSAKPDKEIDGRTFKNVDPRPEPDSVPSTALPSYDKKHYDQGGDYDHWDKDKTYWRLKKEDKPMV
ncbi:MAG: hypothetical protein E6Q76_15685 [Rhizobium sp.]|nr:MAG: hypothetical protein E6Q76_15685 [Rhizobium sp.]